MKEQIRQYIQKAIEKLYSAHTDIEFAVDYAPPDINADFASNVAMVLGKKLEKNPMEVAAALAAAIPDLIVDPGSDSRPPAGRAGLRGNDKFIMTIAAPGFLNFKFSSENLLRNLQDIIKRLDSYGSADLGQGKLAIVEYFQLNVAKPPHVGHLRSAVIGDSLKRILKFIGYKTVSDTHIGDWGTQLGIFIYALKQQPVDMRGLIIKNINTSAQVYADFSRQIEADPSLKGPGKQEFVQLEKGDDEENRKYWRQIVEIANEELEKQVRNLKLLPFDHKDLGESFYEDKMPAILKHLEQKGLLKTGKTGEKYVDLEQHGLGRLICIKSDGGTTYELRDLATLAYRYDELAKKERAELAWNLYVVDSRQSHDFKQVFKTMKLLGYDVSKSRHVDFGFMSLPEGTISTRKGNVISLEALLSEAKERALGIIKKKNPDLKNKQKVAEMVGLAAIKYGDLTHNRRSDIIFEWDKALSFEGNTGPYLQYTHARLRSILRKSDGKTGLAEKVEISEAERKVLVKLLYFPDIVQGTAKEFMPNILANYLYELSGEVNNFYEKLPVLQEKDEKTKLFRIALVEASVAVLKKGLYLLGIEAPEEM